MSEHNALSAAKQANQPPPPERRRAVRFQCKLKNSWRLLANTTCCSGNGTVHDISVQGLSLIVSSSLRPGMFLTVSLQDEDGQAISQPLMVRVRRVAPRPDSTWIAGCTFVKKLSDEELRLWL